MEEKRQEEENEDGDSEGARVTDKHEYPPPSLQGTR